MAEPTRPRKPEIMSPAGYWPQLQAAIEAGADAVDFGLRHFTAPAKVGFTLTELPEVIQTLHQHGHLPFMRILCLDKCHASFLYSACGKCLISNV
jgi:collagenase-like PrtC family protease